VIGKGGIKNTEIRKPEKSVKKISKTLPGFQLLKN
jgi:hypothetical protein